VETQRLAAGKKNAARLGAHIVFVDESGFMLIPTVRRTWAPVGETPIIRYRYNHARISVIGGLSISPKRRRLGFYFRLHAKNISRDEVQDFLWYLLKHLRGHVIVVWDGARIHHAKGLADIGRRYPRLHLEKLPAYAPELNPIEAAWHAVKHPLANGQPDDIPQLGRALLVSLRKARASQRVLRGCVSQSDLPLFLPRLLH
jgi:transposase